MKPSPLSNLASRHLCTCNAHATRRTTTTTAINLTRTLKTTSQRPANVPSPASPFAGSAEDLRRKYQPKETRTEVNHHNLEYAKLRARNRNLTLGILVTALATFGTVYFWPGETRIVRNDAPPASGIPGIPSSDMGKDAVDVETVETGTSHVPTFPKILHLADLEPSSSSSAITETGEQEYHLVGLGIRTVSFLSIQVYVVGMYVAVSDIAKLQERLIRTQDPVATTLVAGEKAKLRHQLLDAEASEEIWNTVLKDGDIRSVFRIVPTRNTDFSHLRDAFVKQVTSKTQHFTKKGDKTTTFDDPEFGTSMRQLKELFSQAPRKNLPKGQVLLLGRDAKGRLLATYEDPKGVRTRFGKIEDERISRLVWLQYLSGKTSSSEEARRSVVEGVMEFVERPVGTVAGQVV